MKRRGANPATRVLIERGQALVEFAITGSLALIALAFLVQIGLRMNYQQEIEQQTFRHALRKANDEGDHESQATTYYHIRDRQVPDPNIGFAIRPRVQTQANSVVTWGQHLTLLDNDRNSQPRILVNLNSKDERSGDSFKEFRSEDLKKETKRGPDDGAKDPDDATLPLVRHVSKDMHSHGAITQTQAGGTTSSKLTTTTTEDTTVELNTKNGDTLHSKLDSQASYDW